MQLDFLHGLLDYLHPVGVRRSPASRLPTDFGVREPAGRNLWAAKYGVYLFNAIALLVWHVIH